MRKVFALCLLALVALTGNVFAGAEGRLNGKVLDAATKKGIPDVKITIVATKGRNLKQDYKTDKTGFYSFIMMDGTLPYKISYSADGYATIEEPIKLKPGDIMSKDVELLPAAAAVATGSVTAKTAGDPAVLAYNEGVGLANDNKNAEAIVKMEEAVTTKPDLVAGYQGLAMLYLRTKQYDKAIDRANKALAIDSDMTDMYAVLAEAYTATGNKEKAAEVKKKLPTDAVAVFNSAAQLINAGKDAEAEPLLKQAIAANDKLAPAYYELGMLYVRASKNAEAKANLEKFIALEPTGSNTETAKEMLKYISK